MFLNLVSAAGLPLTLLLGEHEEGPARATLIALLVLAAVAAPIGAWLSVIRAEDLVGNGAPRMGALLWWSSVLALIAWPLSILQLVLVAAL